MNENSIAERISDNPDIFSEVIDAYEDKLMRYIMRTTDISDMNAENLLQDIFIKIYRYIHEYDSRYSFSGWIYRIAHNMIIDNFRKNQKHQENISLEDEEYMSVIASLSDGNSPHNDLNHSDIKSCVQHAIALLRYEYREVILLKCIE